MRTFSFYAVVVAILVAGACRSTPPVSVPTDGQVDASPDPPAPPPTPTSDGSTGSDVDVIIDPTDACTLITARTVDELSTTCATRSEAETMAQFILRQRDGGAAPKTCSTFPPTVKPLITICASDAEVLRAIDFLSQQRQSEMQRRAPARKR